MALLPQGCGRDAQAGGLWPGLKNRCRLLPRALGRVQGEQVEQVGDAGHQGEQGGEEGDEENKEDGGSPNREEAGLGGCSRVVVPAPPHLKTKKIKVVIYPKGKVIKVVI